MRITNPAAWNNFLTYSGPSAHATGSDKRSAAIAAMYMGAANNGGLNSFLTCTWDLDADEVLSSLKALGAAVAARQLEHVLDGLGQPLPASSQDHRYDLLDMCWTDALNEHDTLSTEADVELMRVLDQHVQDNEAFYLALKQG